MATQNYITGPDKKFDKKTVRRLRSKKPETPVERPSNTFLSKAVRRLAEGTKTHEIKRRQSTDSNN